jgi:hypothetical protein
MPAADRADSKNDPVYYGHNQETRTMPNSLSYALAGQASGRWGTYYHLFVGRTLRKLVSRFWDPLIRYDLDGTALWLPLSHELPTNRKGLDVIRQPKCASGCGRFPSRRFRKPPSYSCRRCISQGR